MTTRKILPNRRESVTQKIRVGGKRTVYLSTDITSGGSNLELFVRVRGTDVSPETLALYDCLARVISLALQHGCPMEVVSKMLIGSKFPPAGIVTGHPTIHFCSSLPDCIGQHLLSLCPDPSAPKE